MNDYFLDPQTMDISLIKSGIEKLHTEFSKYFDIDSPRMKNTISDKYCTILEKENLEQKGKSPDEVYKSLAYYSQGILKWNHSGALINVNPPVTLPSVVAAGYTSLYNCNGAQDMSCGYLLTTELAVIKMICQLAGLDEKKSGGIFTFGGKSTNLHALKHGLQRAFPDSVDKGVDGSVVTFSSKQGHPCHSEVCGWLGIGKEHCIRIPTDSMGIIDMNKLEEGMRKALDEGKKIALITANGGTTIQMTIDPIKEIVDLRDKLVEEYNLDYKPRVHVDSVIGWSYLFFKTYDFENNPLNIHPNALNRIKRQLEKIVDIKYADSFGVDFHKMGFCAYQSSVYMCKDNTEIYSQEKLRPIPYDELEYGNYSPFQYTLELSRSLNGPVEAYTNLKVLGISGYQELIGGLYNSAEVLKESINNENRFEVINDKDSDGFVTLFVVHEFDDSPSFFDIGKRSKEETREYGMYIYKFYLYLLEQQKRGRCKFALDYSSGYHVLDNGIKIGVLKVYPMTPYFTPEKAKEMVANIKEMMNEFDEVKDSFEVKEVPHKPRPFVFR